MSVTYNSKKIIPAPLVSITKDYRRSNDGYLIGSAFILTLNGKLLPMKGSPNASGIFWDQSGYPPDDAGVERFASLMTKYGALRNLFADDGKPLEFQAQDGSMPLRCFPTVRNINVQEGLWVDYIGYTITLECAEMFGATSSEDFNHKNSFFFIGPASGERLFLADANENWVLEQAEPETIGVPHTYRVSHNVSAVGKNVYDMDGSKGGGSDQAKKWVLSKTGYNSDYVLHTSGINLPSYYVVGNHTKVENLDELNGSYSLNETWIATSGTVIETFDISVNSRASEALVNIGIQGTINGIEYDAVSKYDSANNKLVSLLAGDPVHEIYRRATNYSGRNDLNIVPMSKIIGRNPVGGTVTYTFEYNNRPTNFITGSLYESLHIAYSNENDMFGNIPILGRSIGPLLQNVYTVSDKSLTLSMEIIMPIYSGSNPTTLLGIADLLSSSPKAQVDDLFNNLYNHFDGIYDQVFKHNNTEQWEPLTGRYSRSITCTFGD
jgi:hypothetical protein